MKRNSPLRRYTPLHSKKPMKRTGFAPHPKRKRAVSKRLKLPKPSTVRNKCDDLLTPIIKGLYPNCLLRGAENCPGVTQVAHHHVHKANSNRLRYDIENLIPLCGACHTMLHNNESFWGAKVAQIKGKKWFKYIESVREERVKADVHWYLEHYARLTEIHTAISKL